MFKLTFDDKSQGSIRQILCFGAHSDDIEIGCGGTILKLIETYPQVSICWVVFGATGEREQEAIHSASSLLAPVHDKKILVQGFRDGFFPYQGIEIKECFEQLKQSLEPDLIFTHYRQDLHQDHRLISELTWNTFRNHWILEYEIPKYDGDIGNPNLFVHLSENQCQKKISHIIGHFGTQSSRQWFSEETFSAILTLRGIESNAPTRYAEAFHCRKIIF